MPSFFSDGNTPNQFDSRWKVLQKILGATIAAFSGAGSAFTVGAGAPEGVVVGSPGDTYWDSNTGFEYRKVTGAATNTGWQIH